MTSPKPVTGLSSSDAGRILTEVGANELASQPAASSVVLLLRQFASPVIWLLLGAGVVSAVLGEVLDAGAILVIVVVNAIIGFVQEFRAQRAVLALRSMTAPRARVMRDGHSVMVPSSTVVQGDVLLLEAGDVTAADSQLVEANALSTNEAPLTGESAPVEKNTTPTDADTPLAERRDFVFMGTSVSTGSGTAVVVATGMKTELGKIAHLLATAEESATPLQDRLARVSKVLLLICVGIVALVAIAGVMRGWPAIEVFMVAVSLAVAAVPEGLPAVVTIALAVGVQRMAARNVLVRRLPAVETLGNATVICTDKTGTLTTGVMRVRDVWGGDGQEVLAAAAACVDAELEEDGVSGVGDPSELAILIAAAERGIHRGKIEESNPRVEVKPFDTLLKRMSIQRADRRVYIKGAIESVLPLCVTQPDGVDAANIAMAERGLRVLAVAVAPDCDEERASLQGLIGIADPPRPEAVTAIAEARAAGITTVMITGDHPLTALAIAKELGIVTENTAEGDVVHARATGDGVNDAPALREAHVGIAMGRTGTEVTREASDMVLADDNFASIVAAIREGRGIFDNIRNTLVYLLSGNMAELTVMLVAALSGLPLPLVPLQLLWINVVTDGVPALALVLDPPEKDVLMRPPRSPEEPMLGAAQWRFIVLTGVLQAAVTLGVYLWALDTRELAEARDLAFSVLVFGELFRALAARSTDRVFWEVGVFTNVRLLIVVVLSVLLQYALHHIPIAQRMLDITPLSARDCALTIGAGLVPVTIIELTKLLRRARRRRGDRLLVS